MISDFNIEINIPNHVRIVSKIPAKILKRKYRYIDEISSLAAPGDVKMTASGENSVGNITRMTKLMIRWNNIFVLHIFKFNYQLTPSSTLPLRQNMWNSHVATA